MSSNRTPIRTSDRLQNVFERDERLIDIIASHSPQLAKLRNSPMRRIMARVTTVEQAARLCGISAASLVHDLNNALGIDPLSADHGSSPNAAMQEDVSQASGSVATQSVAMPMPLFAAESVVELDVRDELRNGGEPFPKIMTAFGALRDGEVLHLHATFEPVPLFAVMEKRGFAHHAEQHGPEDWSVWFYRAVGLPADQSAEPRAPQTEPMREAPTTPETERDIWLDVRGLEPPEPMVRTLEALEGLPAESTLVHINVRVPQLLLPILRERGFQYTIDQSQPDQVQVRIWRIR